jgi:hypothetical protein
MRTLEETKTLFAHKEPNEHTLPLHLHIEREFQDFIDRTWPLIPDGPSKTLFYRRLHESKMLANSAIANNGA